MPAPFVSVKERDGVMVSCAKVGDTLLRLAPFRWAGYLRAEPDSPVSPLAFN